MKFNFCVACLATDDLHHHHLVARVNGGSDDETNLITLCYSCHRAIHGMRQKSVNHRELCKAGIEKRRSKGLPVGKQVSPKTIESLKEAMDLIDRGLSKEKAAKAAGVSIAHLYRHIQEIKCKDAERVMAERLYSPEEAARYSGVTIKVFNEYLSKHNIEVSITANNPEIIEDIEDHFHYLT